MFLSAPVDSAEPAKDVLAAIVRVRSDVPADARTAPTLGTEREGSGVVIDSGGLILTIGYLILEAMGAEVGGPGGKPINANIVGYDHNTGFGLLRATRPLGVTPMKFGKSSAVRERDEVLVASHGGPDSVQAAIVASRREFAGYWEYLLENAIFTVPPHPNFGGAALIGRDGRLLGIGSLLVQDAVPGRDSIPGNMFVPIDQLKPILADLMLKGRSAEPPRPWLGIFGRAVGGRILVLRVSPGGPADQAGLRSNDMIVGVAGEVVEGLADFYRKVWTRGRAGVEVPLNVLQGTRVREVIVRSADRYRHLRLKPSY
ncbi:MAG: S1C family serine protease [Candidatus Binatia bacterium]